MPILSYYCVHGVCNCPFLERLTTVDHFIHFKTQHSRHSCTVRNTPLSHTSAILNHHSYCPIITPNLPGIIPKSNLSTAQSMPQDPFFLDPQLYYPTVILWRERALRCIEWWWVSDFSSGHHPASRATKVGSASAPMLLQSASY